MDCSDHLVQEAGLSQRFYFDLANGFETIRDHRGVEARDLYQAIEETQVVLEELRKNGVLAEDEEGWRLLIKDARKVTLMTLPVVPRVPTLAIAS